MIRSIARALYGLVAVGPSGQATAAAGGLLILDDPLSAVDARVGAHIFEHGVLGYAKLGGTVLMAMNQLYLLPRCDYVVHLADGAIATQGLYSELCRTPAFINRLGQLIGTTTKSVDDILDAVPAVPATTTQIELEDASKDDDGWSTGHLDAAAAAPKPFDACCNGALPAHCLRAVSAAALSCAALTHLGVHDSRQRWQRPAAACRREG